MRHTSQFSSLASLSLVLLFWLCGPSQAQIAVPPADPLRPPAVTVEGVPTVPAPLSERLRQYQAVRSASFQGWAADGLGILIATRFGDTTQLHRVATPGSRREQITFFNEPATGRFIPKATDASLLLTMSQGGSENDQIYLLDATTGRSTLYTDGKSRHLRGPVRPDGSQLIIHGNQRNGRDTDLFLADVRHPGRLQPLLEVTNEHWTAVDWSADGTALLLQKYISINESYPALFDLSTRRLTVIPLPTQSAACGPLRFSHDGAAILMATDLRGEFRELARVETRTGAFTWLTADIPWDVSEIEVQPQGGGVAIATNEDGASGLYLFEDGRRRRLDIPLGMVSGLEFSPDGKHLGFTLSQPSATADVFSIALHDGTLTRWTFSEVGGLRPESFVTASRIQFPSFDDRQIPAYYFRPRSASPDQPAAVVINIHGGPESQYRPNFSGFDQFYCNELGIAVIHPNVRGSAGYGKTYLKLDNADRREESVRDIGALLDWIALQPELDSTRVAVMGGSYGGYMVLASLTNYPERIRAGVDVVGIASFRTFLKNTSPYRQDLRRAEYGDERDPRMQAYFERIDPLENASKIRSALLVVHGRNDPRVPFSEAEQIAERVRAQGRDVWTVFADNEGHGFAKKPNRDYQSSVVALFLKTALGVDRE